MISTPSNKGVLGYSYQGDKQVLTPVVVVNNEWTDQGELFSTFGATGIMVIVKMTPNGSDSVTTLQWRVMLQIASAGDKHQEQKYAGDAETITVRLHKFDPTAAATLLTAGGSSINFYFIIDSGAFSFGQLQIFSVSGGVPVVNTLEIRRMQ